jgi:hypothetical protein
MKTYYQIDIACDKETFGRIISALYGVTILATRQIDNETGKEVSQ